MATLGSQTIDLTGNKYNRLLVDNYVGKNKHGHPLWDCSCDCGNSLITSSGQLKQGKTKSCGCLNIEMLAERNLKKTIEVTGGEKPATSYLAYQSYMSAIDRCNNQNTPHYKYYGGSGIKVNISFKELLEEIGEKPNNKMSLDRIDVNGNYEKGNIRWADDTTQARNKRITKTAGVYWRADTKKWRAYIGVNNKLVHLGTYIKKQDAIKARKMAMANYW